MDQEEKSPWQYKPDRGQTAAKESGGTAGRHTRSAPDRRPKSIGWEAPEYIGHSHGPAWYFMLTVITLVLVILIYWLAKDTVAAVFIGLVGIIVGVFASQKPGTAKYEISDSGLSVNGKVHRYSDYKSFAVIREGELTSVNLFPLKRLMPPLSAYFEDKNRASVVEALGEYLPYEDRKLDGIDRLARRLRI